jgi:hypothetical protein
VYEIVPTGKRLARVQAANAQSEVPGDECGQYGVSANAQRFFQISTANPTKALFVNLGQDGSLLDVDSITIKKI